MSEIVFKTEPLIGIYDDVASAPVLNMVESKFPSPDNLLIVDGEQIEVSDFSFQAMETAIRFMPHSERVGMIQNCHWFSFTGLGATVREVLGLVA